MTQVVLSIGANIGEPHAAIRSAVDALGKLLTNFCVSSVYETKPWGELAQPNFLNCVCIGSTDLAAETLLVAVNKLEHKLGRTPTRRWGPRVIDIDIIFFGNQEIHTKKLDVPHRQYKDRDFVLVPLLELWPMAADPVDGQRLDAVLAAMSSEKRTIIRISRSRTREEDLGRS